jgi:hypothetical protein
MLRPKKMRILVCCVLALSACDAAVKKEQAAPQQVSDAPPALETKTAAPLASAGKPETVTQAEEDGMQYAASVVEMTYLQKQGDLTVKLFGTAGGDPAMNGLYTYIAFFAGPAESWKVFRLGDFLEYRILSETPGRLDLELKESVMNDSTGEIGSQVRNLIISWTPGPQAAAPENISVTPAK